MNQHDGLHNALISGTAAIALHQRAATNAKTSQEGFLGSSRRLVTDRSWLKAPEGVTLWGSVVGAAIALLVPEAYRGGFPTEVKDIVGAGFTNNS